MGCPVPGCLKCAPVSSIRQCFARVKLNTWKPPLSVCIGPYGPMLTDSGDFQVFSLTRAKHCRIDENGAHFKHLGTGQPIHMTPQRSIETQQMIGADIIMAFDDCVAESAGKEAIMAGMQRTHRWLMQAKEMHSRSPYSAYGHRQALFGIV